ncbi:hypothetical protein CD995_13510 [Salmonella enterica]|nr:hypothetical protein [Salmonella enterica subsp. enterica serovar Paratyphi B]EAT5876616.1 hypothetical protein [Salmonella enterica]EBS4907590.1 hypothetical protein [Salmonella enterica subsp. enterica serovar Kingabwa]EDB6441973.1 hypothetical protein [Salmonella enterica subsp. enterica serovar Newport]HAD0221957.1 hypothetical protein [Salmonella enterica subsp. enterica serovar Typhimurium]
MVLTLYEGLIEHQIYPGLFNTAYYEGNNMFSLIKSRKVLFITTLLLLSSAAQPAFALGGIGDGGSTADCAKVCSLAAGLGPLGFLICF